MQLFSQPVEDISSLWVSPSCCDAGGMAGGFFATSVGNGHPLGVEGWRFAFFLIASVSVFTGILTLLMASDPRRVCPTMAVLCAGVMHLHSTAPTIPRVF